MPFVVIPAVIGSTIIVFLVRLLGKRDVKNVVLLLAFGVMALLIAGVKPVTDADAIASLNVAAIFVLTGTPVLFDLGFVPVTVGAVVSAAVVKVHEPSPVKGAPAAEVAPAMPAALGQVVLGMRLHCGGRVHDALPGHGSATSLRFRLSSLA